MSDQQLLDLAAKAAMRAGLKLECPDELDGVYVSRCSGRNGYTWNPLEDDGDALRLAVKLSIGIRSHGPDHWNQPNTSVALYDVGEFGGGRVQVSHGSDQSASTRRAIVLAAFKIGESMQEAH